MPKPTIDIVKKKGVSSMATAIIIALGSISTAFITALATSSSNLATIKGDIRVVEERENNHYGEVEKRLGSIEGKLDEVISTKGSKK